MYAVVCVLGANGPRLWSSDGQNCARYSIAFWSMARKCLLKFVTLSISKLGRCRFRKKKNRKRTETVLRLEPLSSTGGCFAKLPNTFILQLLF